MSKYDILPECDVIRVHGHANFGSITPRQVVDEGVVKSAFGYDHGYTASTILMEHGFLRKDRRTLTKRGVKYLRELGAYKPAIAHVLGEHA